MVLMMATSGGKGAAVAADRVAQPPLVAPAVWTRRSS
jgi:hypothetical protein